MSRLGTCKHCYQAQEVSRMPAHLDPLDPKSWARQTAQEHYTCQWLETAGALPPPIKRYHGAFCLRETDCDVCPRYAPVEIAIPGVRL